MFKCLNIQHIIILHCIHNVINDPNLNLHTLKDVYNLFDVLSQTPGHGNRRSTVEFGLLYTCIGPQ